MLLEAVRTCRKQGPKWAAWQLFLDTDGPQQIAAVIHQFVACGASIHCRVLRQTDHLLTCSTLLLQAT